MKLSSFRANRLLQVALLVMMTLMLTPRMAQANDYLEQQYNYSIYTSGPDKIHFKIPVWAYGTINDYLALPMSHVSYQFPGKGEVEILRWVAHARSNNNEDNNRGTVAVQFPANMGDIIVTSMANGVNHALQGNGEWSDWLTVVQHPDGDYDRVTFLEFDWYPPETMDTIDFSIKLYSTVASKFSIITRAYIDENVPDDYYHVPEADQIANNWTYDGPFRIQNNSVTPQLYTPYLYQLNENGLTGYGYAAIPYSVFDEPISYTTSYNPTTVKLGGDDRAGSLYIMTDDTIHNDVYADFQVWRNKEVGTTKKLRSTSVKVAPYHRIYNFMGQEDLDSTGTFTGSNVLRWSIKNPTLTDIVEGDYFVIERATDSLFSDARQLTMVALGRDSTGMYQFVDASRDTWTGNMSHPDTLLVDLSRKLDDYIIYDQYGNPAYLIDFRISTNKMPLPSVPVYYRIARASATIWGWDSEFVRDYTLLKNNFLAPLADNQEDYTLDEKYDENHKVHFRIRLENNEVTTPPLVPEEDFDAIYMVKANVRDSCIVRTTLVRPGGDKTIAYLTVKDKSHEFVFIDEPLDAPREFTLQKGWTVTFRYLNNSLMDLYWEEETFEINNDVDFNFETAHMSAGYYVRKINMEAADHSSEYVTPQKIQHLKDSLYQVFQEEYAQTTYGRCMWDKTASLVLVRTMAETGYSTEFIIPQDSIRRQADGSWLATFSDVADQACTHYSYAVRIDQTRSDLRVQYPSQLEPKTLNGPNLYFDKGAEIRSFLASRGVATTETKPGVLLHWVPSNQSVDEFVLQRKVKDTDEADTTIYRGLETTFFDDTALPSVIYEYTVTANFNCNGRATSNSKTTDGWRTPYAEISGTIVLTDNSGMPGVNVALQDSAGTVIRTQTTGPDGSYCFDSLEYNLTTGSTYVLIPTNPYAQFSFNNTSASTAAITLSADNAVASHIDFVNLSCARLTGRALYKNSTVPVADAMFLLNGDTILRSGAPLQTGVDGNFAIIVPMSQPNTLQIIKPGHQFEGDGILQVEEGKDTFALTEPLDGVRFYDLTKVRLVGRVAGGNNQRDLPEAFGVGKNNLGDDLQLILQMEGDNTAHFVHDPNDLTRDTFQTRFPHVVYSTNPQSAEPERTVGETNMLTEKKRIIIAPDPLTGEYEVDLFPVKYKVTQATATGYATLFAAGQGNEVIDLTNAPLVSYTAKYNAQTGKVVVEEEMAMQIIHRDNTISNTQERELTELEVPVESLIYDGDSIHYNAVYDRIYHNPVQISLVQNIYGLERVGYGEPEMEVNGMHPDRKESVSLYTNIDNQVTYTLGYPVFYGGRKYQFKAKAYEEYYYNNTEDGRLDVVPQRGGNVVVRNGLHSATTQATYRLDKNGENNGIWLDVDNVDVENVGSIPTRSVSVALETEGNVVETNVFTAYVTGTVVEESTLRPSDGGIQLLDIVRDPGGAGSYAYIDNGTTYGFGFTQSISAQFGVELQPTWGSNTTQYIGIYSGATAGGSWLGSEVQTQKAFSFSLPISCKIDYSTDYSYSVTTTEQITTSSNNTPSGVGSNADVFVGTTLANITGRAKTISIINDSLFQACQPSLNAGAMLLLAQGTGADGRTYYLVTGQKVVIGAAVNNSFAYSQGYILGTLIPRLAMERQNMMMTFADSAQAQTMANELGQPVYWLLETDSTVFDTIPLNTHRMFVPNDGKVYVDEVNQLNNEIAQWMDLVYSNEKEKVLARTKGTRLGTYSASSGTSYSYSDTYECGYNYSEYPQTLLSTFKRAGTKMIGTLLSGLAKRGLLKLFNKPVATSAASALNEYYTSEVASTIGEDGTVSVDKNKTLKTVDEVAAQAGNMKFHMKFAPIKDFSTDKRMSTTATITKSVGFTLVPDAAGEISVSVYKAELDSAWNADTEEVLDEVGQSDNDVIKYGSYVFYTEGGATMCPHEEAETTDFYNPGTPLGNGTEWVAKPELVADTYEKTNISPDKRATFRVQLFNQGQVDAGPAEAGQGFYLCLDGASNPDGAKVYVNGAPLIQSVYYWLVPGSPLTQTIEVERGTVDDYNLRLSLYSADCPLTSSEMDLGVHFMPLSTDVRIDMPRQNWVMNTLSPRDSSGYYLPVTIDGFDIHHKNFDHIEFQYKLATQSDDDWVNLCSFYASDSLYDLASGSKAMIENGRISPFGFYGERDPMEQRYDLRAVSFCRYGSGYVSKASTVVSGTKDTRNPVVFGEPEPANAILGVGDNLLLRFNEAIAGNYLDEDNNFQIIGVTNQTGLAASTALHFDGNASAYTKAKRDLTDKSYTIDMVIRPAVASNRTSDMILFETGNEQYSKQFILTRDNRLKMVHTVGKAYLSRTSKPIGSLLAFTRVLFVYEKGSKVRFFVGTTEYTDQTFGDSENSITDEQGSSAYFRFGTTYEGDMLETRIWTKALTLEEISATANHSLTGYEHELLAYYQMDEGKGETVTDLAHGATLYLDGCSWNKQKGFSLRLDGTKAVKLDGNLLGRSSVYDETLMFWFKAETDGTLFSADRHEATDSTAAKGTLIALENGKLIFRNGEQSFTANASFLNDGWHHFVLPVSRTYNNASLFIDGKLYRSFDALQLEGIMGAMYLGGNGFKGNIDEFVIFEQALPKSLVETYEDIALTGDEMGLMAYLPFEEQYLNPNGVLEQRFSGNDKRIFKDPLTGETIEKIVPLIINEPNPEEVADGINNAPVKAHGLLSKLYFNWSFNNDELMINLLNRDYEINKQPVYVTVRDVEDLNGNPMVSPITWTAFVDRNSLKWSTKQILVKSEYQADYDQEVEVRIINHSGKRHTFTIESLPSWLRVSTEYGAIEPMGEQIVRLTFNRETPVGEYTDIIYLTDEDGLSEPLSLELNIEAICPWDEVNENAYDNTMSIRGQVLLVEEDGSSSYDTATDDVVAVFCEGELVGKASPNEQSYVYLTVNGNSKMLNKVLSFKLWQASTGMIYHLKPSETQRYQNNAVRGYSPNKPVELRLNPEAVTQQIALNEGWNWLSFNLAPVYTAPDSILTYGQGFQNGDIVKTPSERQFSTLGTKDNVSGWYGTLEEMSYKQMYMVRTSQALNLNVEGIALTDEQRQVTLGYGWTSIAYLLDEPQTVTEALADYYSHAQVGDIIKSKKALAVFSENGQWEGSLQTLYPGQGYMIRRLSQEVVTMRFFPSATTDSPARRISATAPELFTNPQAATNMTIIAKINSSSKVEEVAGGQRSMNPIHVYVDGDLAAVAHPQLIGTEALYFITVQSDHSGQLTFELDGNRLEPINSSSKVEEVPASPAEEYEADTHFGTISEPVLLMPEADLQPRKLLENGLLYIQLPDGTRYSATGEKVNN